MMPKKRVKGLLARLDAMYPYDAKCFLDYDEPWQLMTATILSAQCTDARVNAVTPGLFAKYPTAQALAAADIDQLAEDVRSTGFYRNKARNIKLSMSLLTETHGGEMPSEIGALTAFPGVGRKTANVIRGHIFNIQSIVVDTHVKRVSARLGLTANSDPEKIEYDLMKVLPKDHWIRYNTQIISHGRAVCRARRPLCAECGLFVYCEHNFLDNGKANGEVRNS